MKKVLFGTGNQTRLQYVQGMLSALPIELVSLKDEGISFRVKEEGRSPLEISRKKALEYHRISKLPTFSIDAGLYIDTFPEDKQPGIFVKRIYGTEEEASDEDMLAYYIKEIEKCGGTSRACWKIALTFVKDEEHILSTVFERKTVLTSSRCAVMSEGEPLNAIQIDPRTGKYESELTVEERIESQKVMVSHIQSFMREAIDSM